MPNVVISDVCRVCFRTSYNISHSYVDNIIREIKSLNVSTVEFPLSDKTALDSKYAAMVVKLAVKKGIVSNLTICFIHNLTPFP